MLQVSSLNNTDFFFFLFFFSRGGGGEGNRVYGVGGGEVRRGVGVGGADRILAVIMWNICRTGAVTAHARARDINAFYQSR